MLPKDGAEHKIVRKLSSYIPAFTDVFDEESFYIFAFCFVIAVIIGAVVVARRVELEDAGHID